MEALKESVAQLSIIFNQRMESFENESLKNPAATTSSSVTSDFAAFKKFVVVSLHALQDQVELLDRGADNIEMRSRRKMLLFHGLPEDKQENPDLVIMEAVIQRLNISNFAVSDISRCHRMGRPTDKARPILVKFRDVSLRDKIWASKTILKGSGVTLSEFLTRPRHETFMAAREHFGMSKCWTRDGFVHIVDAEGARHRISCMKELNNIPKPAKQTVGKPAPRPPQNREGRRATASKK